MIQYDTIWYNTGYQSIMGTHNMMLTIMRPYVVRHENFGPKPSCVFKIQAFRIL